MEGGSGIVQPKKQDINCEKRWACTADMGSCFISGEKRRTVPARGARTGKRKGGIGSSGFADRCLSWRDGWSVISWEGKKGEGCRPVGWGGGKEAGKLRSDPATERLHSIWVGGKKHEDLVKGSCSVLGHLIRGKRGPSAPSSSCTRTPGKEARGKIPSGASRCCWAEKKGKGYFRLPAWWPRQRKKKRRHPTPLRLEKLGKAGGYCGHVAGFCPSAGNPIYPQSIRRSSLCMAYSERTG